MPVTQLDTRSALVVIDLQQGTAAGEKAPYPINEVISRTVTLADAFRNRGLPVVLVRMTSDGSDTRGRTDMSGRAPHAWPDGWDQLVDELSGHPEDIVVTKRNWGAFYGTDLDLHLRRRDITQIVLTGVATSLGVESSARAAHEHGYSVTVVTDAVTDIRPETHANSVERIFPLLAETGTTADVLELLTQ
ncbi:isochorismatase family protein [Nocardia sp. 348MFTsu5.1]|uniref:isochorismatase family protein n=1 Tax=Nocardia sp. 348MFTsu5.1 TaxID=1172185 RepID=UPI0004909460|nr:isochorismatase family protein [Nocardia sp. 348MFTsu5.1]